MALALATAAAALCADRQFVVQLGFGKSGTTSAAEFFQQMGYPRAGCFDHREAREALSRGAPLLSRAVERARGAPCFVKELWDVLSPNHTAWYSLTHLHDIRTFMQSRRTLFLHVVRNSSRWVDSVVRWGSLAARLRARDLDGLPPGVGSPAELEEWYVGANAYIAFAFAHHPAYVRLDVESNASVQRLQALCRTAGRMPRANANRARARPPRPAVGAALAGRLREAWTEVAARVGG